MERDKRCGEKRFQKEQEAGKREGGLLHTQGGRSLERGGGVERVASGASGAKDRKLPLDFGSWELTATQAEQLPGMTEPEARWQFEEQELGGGPRKEGLSWK